MTPRVIKEGTQGAWDQGMELTMDTVLQVIHECATCCKEASQVSVVGEGDGWTEKSLGKAWQIVSMTLQQS